MERIVDHRLSSLEDKQEQFDGRLRVVENTQGGLINSVDGLKTCVEKLNINLERSNERLYTFGRTVIGSIWAAIIIGLVKVVWF